MKHYEFMVALDVEDDGPPAEVVRVEIQQNLSTHDAQEVGIKNVAVTRLVGKGIDTP